MSAEIAAASMGETLRVTAGDRPAALVVPPVADLAVLAVALCAVSTSGPIIAATAAPALAIAFWRNTMASVLLLPLVLTSRRAELRGLDRRERRLAVTAGLLLAAHFATWVPSIRYTTVSSATALVSTQPIWAALLARQAGLHVPRRAWLGIVIAVAGAGLVTGVDVTASGRALAGDLLAVAGGACAAAYMVAGNKVRQSVSTTTYTSICYLTTAVVLLMVCVLGRQSLAGYSGNAWLKLVALTIGAQLLGHSLFNRVLRTTSPTVASLAILLEVPGATLLAAVWLHQRPHVAAVPGLLLLLLGIGTVIAARDRSTPPAVPVE
jgi:drug/metabolite transporter (DMT)-like permease